VADACELSHWTHKTLGPPDLRFAPLCPPSACALLRPAARNGACAPPKLEFWFTGFGSAHQPRTPPRRSPDQIRASLGGRISLSLSALKHRHRHRQIVVNPPPPPPSSPPLRLIPNERKARPATPRLGLRHSFYRRQVLLHAGLRLQLQPRAFHIHTRTPHGRSNRMPPRQNEPIKSRLRLNDARVDAIPLPPGKPSPPLGLLGAADKPG
jgi:hypothetical protein